MFISIGNKYKAYNEALILIQSFINESFSIAIMKSRALRTPIIINNKCEVTKNFVIESNGDCISTIILTLKKF